MFAIPLWYIKQGSAFTCTAIKGPSKHAPAFSVISSSPLPSQIFCEPVTSAVVPSGYIKDLKDPAFQSVITTLLAAIILFFMGSGPVKGFAVTLGVGIFTTLFSVYFIARLFTSIYVSRNKDKEKLI